MNDEGVPREGESQFLTPAAPRRPAHALEHAAPDAGVDGYVVDRLAGLDRLVRAVADRVVALDQRIADGFQEAGELSREVAEDVGSRLDELEAKVDTLALRLDAVADELHAVRRRLPLRAEGSEAPSEAALDPAPEAAPRRGGARRRS